MPKEILSTARWSLARRQKLQFTVILKYLADEAVLKSEILATPAAKAFEDDPDWELIEIGGDWSEFKDSENPSQCVCGNWWTAKVADKVFANKPNQNDITALMKTVPAPTDKDRPKCDDPCESVVSRNSEAWCIFKNKKTGQFGLTCTKSTMWHCELNA